MDNLVTIEKTTYELIENHREGFNQEALEARYSEILNKYDYIFGDWGHSQLRLKGFYENGHPKANFETKIGNIEDYIYEYCNFGCAYFILKKIKTKPIKKTTAEK